MGLALFDTHFCLEHYGARKKEEIAMPETLSEIIADARKRLSAISDLAPGECAEFTIRIERPIQDEPLREKETLLNMKAMDFFTQERLEQAVEALGMQPAKHKGVITMAANGAAAVPFDQDFSKVLMKDWLAERPSTAALLRTPMLGRVTVRILFKATTLAGLPMVDNAGVDRKK